MTRSAVLGPKAPCGWYRGWEYLLGIRPEAGRAEPQRAARPRGITALASDASAPSDPTLDQLMPPTLLADHPVTRAPATLRPPAAGPCDPPATARVAVVDDSPSVCSALARLLRATEGVHFVGSTSDPAEAVRLCLEAEADVVVLDLHMSRLDGAELTRLIARERPRTRVVILTADVSGPLPEQALAAGARSVVAKHQAAGELLAAIRAAAAA